MKNQSEKVNLFIVGAPKCGTTSLYHYLKQHPEIYMSEKKEPHFFCTDFHKEIDKFHGYSKSWQIRSLNDYNRLFDSVGSEKIIGEASSSYLYSSSAANEIYKYNPDAKIIICLRDPVDFLYSWHSHLAYYFEENLSFQKAIKAEKRRSLDESKIPRKVNFPFRVYYSKMARFSEQVERFKSFFPESQILIVLLNDLKLDVQSEYRRIVNFLDVDSNFKANFEIKNVNKVQSSKTINWLLNSNLTRSFKFLIPEPVIETIITRLRRLNKKEIKRPVLDHEIRNELKSQMTDEVRQLSQIVNRDLMDLWGYH